MKAEQNKQNTEEYSLKKVQEENELLLVQIHQLEEELEKYFKRNQELEKGNSPGSKDGEQGIRWVDDELPDALAEVQRLHALVEALRKTHQLETQNALNVKLGNILIESVDSPGNLVTVPGKVGKIWRESSRKTPPKAVGGKSFEKVIAAYGDGGFKAVEDLFASITLAPAMQANGFTTLARHIMKNDRAAAAEAARRAHEIDPKPFRLKWLAFRLHEAGDVIEAEAMLDILPAETTFSESESRQANQVRNEAKHVRQHEAKQKTRFSERRGEFERRLAKLAKERDEQATLLAEHQKEIEELKLTQLQEEEENELLTNQLFQTQEELENQLVNSQKLDREIEALKHTQINLEKEKADLVDQKNELSKLSIEQETRIEQLAQQKEKVESELGSEIENLEKALANLEAEKQVLSVKADEHVKLATDINSQFEHLRLVKEEAEERYGHEIDALKQAQEQEKEENELLTNQLFQTQEELENQHAEYQKLDRAMKQLSKEKATVESELGSEIENLKKSLANLEAEKQVLSIKVDEHAKLATDIKSQFEHLRLVKEEVEERYGHEIDALKQALEQGKEENELLTNQLSQTQEELKNQHAEYQKLDREMKQLAEEKAELADRKNELSKLSTERIKQIEQLAQEKATAESELGREIEKLKKALANLEEEKQSFLVKKDEFERLSATRQSHIEKLTQEKSAIEDELGREIEVLKQAQINLEKEKAELVDQKDGQARLLEERFEKMEELHQQIKAQKGSETELVMRQNMMQEEMVRAEAQLDLIKDMLLNESER